MFIGGASNCIDPLLLSVKRRPAACSLHFITSTNAPICPILFRPVTSPIHSSHDTTTHSSHACTHSLPPRVIRCTVSAYVPALAPANELVPALAPANELVPALAAGCREPSRLLGWCWTSWTSYGSPSSRLGDSTKGTARMHLHCCPALQSDSSL
jgi:hypothetical protein